MDDLSRHKAKKNIRRELQKSNWDLQSYESHEDIEVMIYIYDPFDTKEIMMAGLRTKDVERLSKFEHPMEVITGSVESAFQSYITSSNERVRAQRTEILGSTLGLYMLNTKTYSKLMSTAVRPGDYRQFIVLRYKNKNTVEMSLRPFSLVSKSKVLEPEEIYHMSQEVIERDEEKNAKFFNLAPVSNLRN